MDPFPEPLRMGPGPTLPSATAKVLYNLARLLHNQGKNQRALFYYKEAAEIMGFIGCEIDEAGRDPKLWLAIVCGEMAVHYQSARAYMKPLFFRIRYLRLSWLSV